MTRSTDRQARTAARRALRPRRVRGAGRGLLPGRPGPRRQAYARRTAGTSRGLPRRGQERPHRRPCQAARTSPRCSPTPRRACSTSSSSTSWTASPATCGSRSRRSNGSNTAGVGFVSISEQMDFSTPIGKVILATLAAFAQYYSDNLSETKKGKAERKAQGLYNGVLPVRHQEEPATACRSRTSRPIPETYPGLLLAFRLAAEGKSDRQVAEALNAAGYRTTGNRGTNRSPRTRVRRILHNRFYLGELPDGNGGWLPAPMRRSSTRSCSGAPSTPGRRSQSRRQRPEDAPPLLALRSGGLRRLRRTAPLPHRAERETSGLLLPNPAAERLRSARGLLRRHRGPVGDVPRSGFACLRRPSTL